MTMDPKKERRLPSVLHHIFNPESRKVGFGWWLFIVSTAMLFHGKIDAGTWSQTVWLAMGLIGGGTVADKLLDGKLESIAGAIGKAIKPAADPAAAATPAPVPGAPQ